MLSHLPYNYNPKNICSYIINKDGNIYYVIDGNNNAVNHSSSASTVIQYAINQLTNNGGKIYICNGIYNIDDTIIYNKDKIQIEGESHGTILRLANNANVDILSANRRNNYNIRISNICIDGNKANNTLGRGLIFTGYYSILDNIFIKDCPENGFVCEVAIGTSESVVDNFVSNIRIHTCNGSGFVWGSMSGGSSSDNYLQNIVSYGNAKDGIDLNAAAIYGWNINAYSNAGHGIIIRGAYSRITIMESADNGKHGVLLYKTGSYGTYIIAGRAYNNSQLNVGTYDGFIFDGDNTWTTGESTLIGCLAFDDQSTKTQQYGINKNYQTAASHHTIIGGKFTENLQTINKDTTIQTISTLPIYTNSILSDKFRIDSTGINTIAISHGISIKPIIQNCNLTVIENTDVDDWGYNLLKVKSVSASNVVAKINISTASSTSGATAKLGLSIV